MSLSTLIANVILKLLKAFGIDPLLFQNKQASWNNETRNSKLTKKVDNAQKVDKKGPQVDKLLDNEVKGSPEYFTNPDAKESKVDLSPGTPLPKADPAGSINEPLKPLAEAQNEGPLLPPEATDPTDAPDWLDELAPDWQTHVNK